MKFVIFLGKMFPFNWILNVIYDITFGMRSKVNVKVKFNLDNIKLKGNILEIIITKKE